MSTLLPFLYQTRTLLSRRIVAKPALRALHSTPRTNSPRQRSRQTKPANVNTNDIPFELPEGYNMPPVRSQAELDLETGGRRSTITPTERETFNRIFEEIAARNRERALEKPGFAAPDAASPASVDVDDQFRVRTEEPNPQSIRDAINIIVQDAAEVHTNSRRQLTQQFNPLHPLGQTYLASEWEKALLRFPPSLRRAARMALGVMETDKETERLAPFTAPVPDEEAGEEGKLSSQIDIALDPLSQSVQNEALRRQERNRVEAKMHEATTDFELWDVLEEEVFPMVHKLGLDEDSKAPGAEAKRKRGRKGNKLPMHIYGPLYPSYLLNALRLFDSKFARSSPLALHVLPRVKELGLASYVLGVSTPFYNELARIMWKRYGDPLAVFDLLEEMRAAGLYCDHDTRAVVQSIDHFLGSVSQGKWGPFLRELASLPEYEFAIQPRIRHWIKTINMQIYERQNELQE